MISGALTSARSDLLLCIFELRGLFAFHKSSLLSPVPFQKEALLQNLKNSAWF